MTTRGDTLGFGVSEEQDCFSSVQNWFSEKAVQFPPSPHFLGVPGLLPGLLCHKLSVEHFEPGHLVCRLLVTPALANNFGTLHGGAIGGLVEKMGCTAIKSVVGPKDGVVSDISIAYITGPRIKEELEFEAKILRLGRTIAVATVEARERKSRKPAAQGRVTMCFEQISKL